MFDHFFRILTSEKSYENEYVMRAVMRLSSALHEGVLPYLSQLMEKLVLILRRSSRVSGENLCRTHRPAVPLESEQTELQSLSLRNDHRAHSDQCGTESRRSRSIRTGTLSGLHSDLHR